ncbi:MAG: glycosyltransferase family 4 protein [Pseudaminobacter sp.]|nr:glycosyltransferase family 4 protein [Pseudaminobacter sp.]
MKIAHVAPLYESVPPKLYGGTERIIAYLVDGLVELGEEVTLFSSADAETKAALAPVRDQALRLDPHPLKSPIAAHLSMLDEVRRRADEFDIIHFHLSHFIHFPFFEQMPEKTVTTPHGRLDYKDLAGAYERWPSFPMISISHRQRQPLGRANWAGTIHHGLPPDLYRPLPVRDEAAGGYLAFLGRLSRDKRPDRAIEIARRSGLPLKIAAKVGEDDRAYFHETIEPLIDGIKVEYIGEIGEAGKEAFLGNAAALLFPIDWPEPFGLVVIEAMACGTPVIAWDEGAMSEIIDEGVTGFIVRSLDQAVAAVDRVPALDRGRVRAVFEERFSASRMVRDYAAIYARLAGLNSAGRVLESLA